MTLTWSPCPLVAVLLSAGGGCLPYAPVVGRRVALHAAGALSEPWALTAWPLAVLRAPCPPSPQIWDAGPIPGSPSTPTLSS